jgi:hypothetical protein
MYKTMPPEWQAVERYDTVELFTTINIHSLDRARDLFVKASRDRWDIEMADVTGQGTRFKMTKESYIMHIGFQIVDELIIPSVEAYENRGSNRIIPPIAYSWGYFALGHGRVCQVCGKAIPQADYKIFPRCEYCAEHGKGL